MSRVAAFEAFRLAEVEEAIKLLRKHERSSGNLLEIGAGRGWQARALSEAGYKVEAIDLPADSAISGHARDRHWAIRDYDGVHIPFADDSFDIIYSSNVLEHVEDLDALMGEMKRVLRRGGIALHLLPNPQWRILSLLTYYPGHAMDLLRYISRRTRVQASGTIRSVTTVQPKWSLLAKLGKRLLPPTHGAIGSPLTEIGRYSRGHWDDYFRQRGWSIIEYSNNGLTASGDYLLGTALSMEARRQIGRMTGGIAHVYLLQPSADEGSPL